MSATVEFSPEVERKKIEAENLIQQINQIADWLAQSASPENELKTGQLREISKSITNLEQLRIPVPDELRNLKTSLLAQVHQTEEFEKLTDFIQEELQKTLAKFQNDRGNGDDGGTKRRWRRKGDGKTISKDVLRDCILQTLKSHGGSAKAAIVLDEMGKMLNGQLSPADMELNQASKQIAWRTSACFEKRKMMTEGLLKDSPGGFWQLTSRHAA